MNKLTRLFATTAVAASALSVSAIANAEEMTNREKAVAVISSMRLAIKVPSAISIPKITRNITWASLMDWQALVRCYSSFPRAARKRM